MVAGWAFLASTIALAVGSDSASCAIILGGVGVWIDRTSTAARAQILVLVALRKFIHVGRPEFEVVCDAQQAAKQLRGFLQRLRSRMPNKGHAKSIFSIGRIFPGTEENTNIEVKGIIAVVFHGNNSAENWLCKRQNLAFEFFPHHSIKVFYVFIHFERLIVAIQPKFQNSKRCCCVIGCCVVLLGGGGGQKNINARSRAGPKLLIVMLGDLGVGEVF